MFDQETRARFAAKVDDSGGPEACHPWKAATWASGYGRFRLGLHESNAHRIAWAIAAGVPVPAGFQVDHLCHNRACQNPAHLRLATAGQNSANRQGARRDSRSGVRGVYLATSGRWRVHVARKDHPTYRATFETLADAELAAILARLRIHGGLSESDRRLLDARGLIWGEDYTPTPYRRTRKPPRARTPRAPRRRALEIDVDSLPPALRALGLLALLAAQGADLTAQ